MMRPSGSVLAVAAVGLGSGALVASKAFTAPNAPSVATQDNVDVVPRLRASAAGKAAHGESSTRTFASMAAFGGVATTATMGIKSLSTSSKRSKRGRTALAATVEPPAAIAGTGGPIPEYFWDPAGLCQNKTEEEILYYRAAELKHGRIAMLAALGWFHHLSGFHLFADQWAKKYVTDNPWQAFLDLPAAGKLQVLFFISVLEWIFLVPCPPPKEAPWDVFGVADIFEEDQPDNPSAGYTNLKMYELNNGRLAMVAIIGLIAQTIVTGEYGQNFFVGESWRNLDAIPVKVPFEPIPLYPGQDWWIFRLEWPTIADLPQFPDRPGRAYPY